MDTQDRLEIHNSKFNIIMQGVQDSVVICNSNGKPVEFNQNLNSVSIDIVPSEYKDRAEIEDIDKIFREKNNMLLLVNGEGGIGKTTLAARYLNTLISRFKHYAWISCESDIVTKILNLYRHLGIDPKEIPNDEQARVLITLLNSLAKEKPCLLVLDNANNEKDLRQFRKEFGALNWQVIVTSRCNRVADIAKIIYIEHLPYEMAKELFKDFYNEGTSEFEDQLDLFLKNIAYNTLLINLFAKYMAACNRFKSDKYTLKTLNADFVQKGLFVAQDSIKIEHKLNDTTVNQLLHELYNLSALPANEANVLFHFAFLPLRPVLYEHLEQLLGENISGDSLDEALDNLDKAGWIKTSKTDNNQAAFKISSQLIQDFIIEHYATTLWDKINPYIKNVTELLDEGDYGNPVDIFQWKDYADSLLNIFGKFNSLQPFLEKPEFARLQNNLALVLQDLGDYNGAKDLLEKAVISAEKKFGEDHPTTAVRYSNLATVLKDLGDYNRAKDLLEKAIISDEKNFGKDHPSTARSYSNLALVLQDFGDYKGAKDLLEKAVISDVKYYGEDHPCTAVSYSNLATVLQDLGDYNRAKELLEKALISDEKNFGEDHPTTAVSYSNLALVLKDLGDYNGAKQLLEKAKISAEKNFGEDHPKTAVRYSNLAVVLQSLGDYNDAKELFEKTLTSNEKNFGEDHPNTAVCYSNLALVLKALGDYNGAKDLLEKAVILNVKNFGEDHPKTAVRYSNLALVLKDLGDYNGARNLLEKAKISVEKNLGEDHPNTARSYSNLAIVLQDLGNYNEAKKLLEKAIISNEKIFGEDHPTTAVRYSNLATVYIDLDQPQKAVELWEKAYPIFEAKLGLDHPYTLAVKRFIEKYKF